MQKKKPEKIDELRERLYTRDDTPRTRKRTQLQQNKKTSVPEDWETRPPQKKRASTRVSNTSRSTTTESQSAEKNVLLRKKVPEAIVRNTSRRAYRSKIILGGLVFFLFTLILSGIFLVWGNKGISGSNIGVEVVGPFAVGGGEVLPLRISVANENAVSIESATLIIEYPPGTQAAGNNTDVFIERRPIGVIASGEVHNFSTDARVFGEENAEKIVQVGIEYRVSGSNATFYKEAEPFKFKISSSPVVLDIESVRSISSGQESEMTLTLRSNSPSPLSGVLVQVKYPFGFDFSEADPAPVSGNSIWRIDTLEPEEEYVITLSGIMSGSQDEEKVFDVSVGLPNERDRFSLASVFTIGTAEVKIEAPFLGVDVSVNDNTSAVVIADPGDTIDVRVTFTNTLDSTVYDGVIEVALKGAAANNVEVNAGSGFFNSTTDTITFDSVDNKSLKEMVPGKSNTVSFSMKPKSTIASTPEIVLEVTGKGKRVFEDRVPQELAATESRTIKFASTAGLTSGVAFFGSVFANTGPTPPVAEQETTYTLILEASAGSNDMTDTVVTATLPPYVVWLDTVSPQGEVSYSAGSRTLSWDAGTVDANKKKQVSIQVKLTPSTSQVGIVPTVLDTQRLRATDRFTGTTVRADAPAVTTALDGDKEIGRVQAKE